MIFKSHERLLFCKIDVKATPNLEIPQLMTHAQLCDMIRSASVSGTYRTGEISCSFQTSSPSGTLARGAGYPPGPAKSRASFQKEGQAEIKDTGRISMQLVFNYCLCCPCQIPSLSHEVQAWLWSSVAASHLRIYPDMEATISHKSAKDIVSHSTSVHYPSWT